MDFVADGGELPDDDNDFEIGVIEPLEYVEKNYDHPVYEKEQIDGKMQEQFKGKYSLKYIELLEEDLAAFVWLPQLKCFGSIDIDHQVVLAYDDVTWDEIIEDPNFYIDGTQADVEWEYQLDFECTDIPFQALVS